MKWCCPGFEGNFENAGRRGLSVFFANADGIGMFLVQARAVEPGVTETGFAGPISLVIETGIRFCPWCGRNLKSWYQASLSELTRSDLRIP